MCQCAELGPGWEDYVPVEMVQPEREDVVDGQDDAKTLKARQKEQAKQRKRDAVVGELNDLRDELHRGNWDG